MGALPIVIVASVTIAALALRHTRWAGVSLRGSQWTSCIVWPLSLLYFPMRSGWNVHAVRCEWTFTWAFAVGSLRNVQHLVGFIIFFLLVFAQIPNAKRPFVWSFAASMALGFLVEIAEGATGIHNCRMRDLIPDMAGALIGAAIVTVILAVRRRADGGGDRQSSRAEI